MFSAFFHSSKFILFTFLFIIILIIYFSVDLYQSDKSGEFKIRSIELSSISKLKASAINKWVNERFADASFIHNNSILRNSIIKYNSTHSSSDSLLLTDFFQKIFSNQDYYTIFIIDNNQNIVLNLNPSFPPDFVSDSVKTSGSNNRTTVSNIYFNSQLRTPVLDIYIPVIIKASSSFTVILKVDPHQYLIPFVISENESNSSFESLLVTMDGDSVFFLTPLKFLKTNNQFFKTHIKNIQLPAVKAVQGSSGIVEGLDYRGIEVVADVRPIEQTPWFLISKLDLSEVYAPVMEETLNNLIFFVLITSFGGLLLLYFHTRSHFSSFKRLSVAEKKFNSIFENSSNAILLLDKELIVDCNKKAEELFGLPARKIIKKNHSELSPEYQANNRKSTDEVKRIIHSVLEGKSSHFEWLYKRNGDLIHTDINLSTIVLDNKKYLLAFIFDITAQKKAEIHLRESENKFLSVFKLSPLPMAISSIKDGKLLDVNDVFVRDTGYSYEELIGRTVEELKLYTNEEDRLEFRRKLLEAGEIYGMELSFRIKSGANLSCLISSNIISINSEPHFLTTIINITDRKKAEEELKKTKLKLSEVLEHSVNLFYSHDINNVVTYLSPQSKQYLGIESTKASIQWTDFITDNPINLKGIEFTNRAIETGQNQPSYELELRKYNGDIIWVEVHEAPVVKDGKTVSIVGSLTDITARKVAEEGLRASEKKYKYLFENNPQPMWIYDLETLRFLEVNQSAIRQYGYSRNEFLNMTLLDIRPSEDVEALLDDIKITNSELNKAGVWRHKKKNNEIIFVEIISHLIDYDNKAARLVLANDVTEQKQAKEAIQKSEREYRNLFENANDAILIFEPEYEIILEVNKNACDLYGFSREELIGKSLKDLTKNVQIGEQRIEKALKNGSLKNFETQHYASEKNTIDLLVNASIIEYEGRIALLSINRDITEQKQASKKLEDAYRQLNNLYNSLPEAIFSLDVKNNEMLEVSPAHQQVFGYPPYEFYNNPQFWYDFVLPEDRPIIDTCNSILASGKTHQYQVRILKPDGGIYWIEATMKPTIDENGNLIRIDGIVADITDRKNSEDALQKSRLLLTNAIEIANMGHWEYDVLTDTFIFNDQFYKIFRTSLDEIGSYSMSSSEYAKRFVHPEDLPLVGQAIQNAIDSSDPNLYMEFEHRILYADGETGYIAVRFTIAKNSEGKTIKTYGVNQDITYRKQAEEELKLSEAKYRNLFDNVNDAILIFEPDTEIVMEVNRKACEVYNIPREEFIGLSLKSLTIDLEAGEKKVAETIQKSGFINFETRQITPDGRTLDLLINASVIHFNGKTAIISVNRDITEKKKSDENIKTLSKAVEQSPVSVVITDPDGKIEYVNTKFSQVTGYQLDELINNNPRILKSGSQSSEFYKNLWETIRSGKTWHGELHNKKKNGEFYWENAIISPIVNSKGLITNFVAVKEDITERKKMLQDLIESKEQAEEASRLKSSFLANMSHELRTPLVGILGFAELLSYELKDPELLEMSTTILSSGHRLRSTLDSILDLSRIEANNMELQISNVDLSSIIIESSKIFKPVAENKRLSFELVLPEHPVIFRSDPNLLVKILDNLISNAIKYTNSGGITIRALLNLSGSDKVICIEVIDTGIGISDKYNKTVFEPFRQVSEGLSRSYEGSGLGLSITKKFVAMLDGDISFKSELGEGTVFCVQFPFVSPNNKLETPSELLRYTPYDIANNLSSLTKILLVEDDPANASVVKAYLKNFASVHHIQDGNKVMEFCEHKHFDLVLLDINLNGITGVQILSELRNLPDYENVPIIAMTAFAMKGDKENFLSKGFNYYISKPFDKPNLLNLINKALRSHKPV